jgi:hypothetical protein
VTRSPVHHAGSGIGSESPIIAGLVPLNLTILWHD